MAVILLTSNNVGTMKITRICKVAAFAALAVMSVSCVEEINNGKNGKSFSFKVGAVSQIETKSVEREVDVFHTPYEVEGVKFTLTSSVSNNFDNPFDQDMVTKGSMIDTEGLQTISKFKMNITSLDGYENNYSNVDVDYASNEWTISHSAYGNITWPDYTMTNGMKFDAWYNGAKSTYQNGTYTISSSSATDSEDFLLAQTVLKKEGLVPLTFYHPLAAIRFVIKGLDSGLKVKSITLKNYNKSGSVSFDGKNSTWSGLSSKGDYTETLNVSELASADATTTFFVIPQSVSDCKFVVVFDANGKETTFEINAPTAGLTGDKLEAGKYYTYTISGGGVVDIDSVADLDNNKVTFKNTGTLPVYVRAALVFYYEREGSDVIIAPWYGDIIPPVGHELDWDWTLASDGFFYSKSAVAVDAEINFEYLMLENDMSGTGAHPTGQVYLEKYVSVQAIDASDKTQAKSAWPSLN